MMLSLFVLFLESLVSFIRIGCIMSDSSHGVGRNTREMNLVPFVLLLGGGSESHVPLTLCQMSKSPFTPLVLFNHTKMSQ